MSTSPTHPASSNSAVRRWVCLGVALLAAGWAHAAAAQLVVDDETDFADFDLSDGVCQVCYQVDDFGNCALSGGCTLIAAIQNANRAADFDVITFSLPAIPNDAFSIPSITTPVRIDGAIGAGRVHIQGPGPSENAPGFLFDGVASAGSEVANVEISGYPTGIEFRNSPGGIVRNCVVRDNQSDGIGIAVTGTSEGARIGGSTDLDAGNVIVGNGRGLLLTGSGQHRVYGNRIGIDETGQANGNSVGIVVGLGAGEGTEIGSGEAMHRNVIAHSENSGIVVSGAGTPDNGTVRLLRIYGNYIGTDPTGTEAAPNGWGIELTRTDSVRIGAGTWGDPRGNLMAGNGIEGNTFPWAGAGIYLNNRNTNAVVRANTFGLGTDGLRLANDHGVVIRGIGEGNEVFDNWIAANNQNGVVITRVNDFEPMGNRVGLNYIGVEAELGLPEATLDALGNGVNGVRIEESSFNQVVANEIGNSGLDGVRLSGEGASENTVEQNVIGAKFSGGLSYFARGNVGSGVAIVEGVNNLVIDNVIGNSLAGVELRNADVNLVTSNRLGYAGFEFDEEDRVIVRNGGNFLAGVVLDEGADDNEIGAPGQGNVCTRNRHCILVLDGTSNVLRENVIWNSFLEAIDLGGDGRDVNDPLDTDTGPNLRQNAPFVTAAFLDEEEFVVEGQLAAAPSTAYVVEAFIDVEGGSRFGGLPVASPPLGTIDVITDASGLASFVVRGVAPPFVSFASGGTVTATDPAGNTSELGALPDESPLLRPVVLQAPLFPELPGPEDGLQLTAPLDVSNLSPDPAIGVEIEIEFELSSGAEYDVDRVVRDEGEATTCTDSVPIACAIGEIEGRSWVSLVAYIDVGAAAFGGGVPYEVRFVVRGEIGGEPFVTNEVVRMGNLAVAVDDGVPSVGTTLAPLYPNPFRQSTTIPYTQSTSEPTTITVFDVLGRRVRTFEPTREPGEHVVVWDGDAAAGHRVASGIYFVKLTADGVHAPVRSVVLLR